MIDCEALIDAMPHLAWSTHPDGSADYCNAAWYRHTGLTERIVWTRCLHPDDRDRVVSTWQTSLQTGEPFECRCRIRNGETGECRWFLVRANPLRGERGEIVCWVGTCTDIHDDRAAAEELASAKEDLEYFAYAASHDLAEPLRTIRLYSQLLERQSASLDEQGRQAVSAIGAAASRMMALLTDLRALPVSAPSKPQRPEWVDSNNVVQEVLDGLRAAREEAEAVVTVDSLPALRVEPSHFAQIIQNLVGNALRYRGGRPARVRIGVDTRGAHPVFFVEDAGEGVDPKYQDAIFEAFQRLHGPRVPGTGLGLTICARTVAHYGGRIWVESSAGCGSRFLFTLPDASV